MVPVNKRHRSLLRHECSIMPYPDDQIMPDSFYKTDIDIAGKY